MPSDLEGTPIEEGEINDILNNHFQCEFRNKGYRRYRGVAMPIRHSVFAERLENFEVRDDDIWVMSYPKTGTTWTQEMAWCISNDLDFEGAKEFLPERFPFLEHSSLFDYTEVIPNKPGLNLPQYVTDSVTFVEQKKSRRFIKTHLPWNLLPRQIREGVKKPKIIYVCRNAKDTCISYFHHCKLLEGYKGSFDDFFKLFVNDSVSFSPFWDHVSGFWKRRDQPNILFLKYEDMRKDLASIVRETGKFLEKDLSDEQVDTLCEHLSFKSMKNNPAVNYEVVLEINRGFNLVPPDGQFMRQGTGGEWQGKMSPQQIETIESWISKNTSDLPVWVE